MVRRSRALELVEEEAGVPYAQTALARRAVRARRRLVVVLLVGALLLVVEAVATHALWAVVAAAAAGAAWGLRAGRLGAIVTAAFLAVLAVLVPLGIAAVGAPDTGDLFAMAIALLWGVAALPDVLTLVRDAELQHAYGLWARPE